MSDQTSRKRRGGENVAVLVDEFSARFGARCALSQRGTCYTYSTLARLVSERGTALAQRVQAGERVALLAPSGADWVVEFFAILHAGAVAVLLDAEQSGAVLAAQLRDSGAVLLLVSPCQRWRARSLVADGVCPTWCAFDALEANADGLAPHGPRYRASDDAAVIAYGAGGGRGVLIGHGSLRFQVAAFQAVIPGRVRRTLAVLAPHQPLGLTLSLLVSLAHGARIEFCGPSRNVPVTLGIRMSQPTHLTLLPEHLESLRSATMVRIAARPPYVGWLFRLRLAIAWQLPTAWRRVLFPSIHRRLGNGLRCIVCGGGLLARETERFFWNIGIRVLQGYGTAEASPIVSFNRAYARRVASVGRPPPGVEVRVDANGEIQTRGPHVMLGYDGGPALPAGEWLSTGDKGRFDHDGYLYIEDRAAAPMTGDTYCMSAD